MSKRSNDNAFPSDRCLCVVCRVQSNNVNEPVSVRCGSDGKYHFHGGARCDPVVCNDLPRKRETFVGFDLVQRQHVPLQSK